MDPGASRPRGARRFSGILPCRADSDANRRWRDLEREVIECRRCPRLVAWREEVARVKVRRHAEEVYWGRPLPGFGDLDARLLLVGLAPAAHGGNRTGRLFTGDRSGDWLFRALHRAGFANQPTSISRDDGLRLADCYIAPAVRCAPPGNKPLRDEFANCRPYLLRELELLGRLHVVVGLGRIGFDAAFESLVAAGIVPPGPKPAFTHGAHHQLSMLRATASPEAPAARSSGKSGGSSSGGPDAPMPAGEQVGTQDASLHLIGTYHPSQQNTFTGRLTESMFDAVFERARSLLVALETVQAADGGT